MKLKIKHLLFAKFKLLFSDCTFHNNKNTIIVQVDSQHDIACIWPYSNSLSITNTNITNKKLALGSLLFDLQHTYLNLSQVTTLVVMQYSC